MVVELIQVNYEELDTLVGRFRQQANESEQMRRNIESHVNNLRQGGWRGIAADSFYREFEQELLPALHRLEQALLSGGETAEYLIRLWQDAETDAANFLLNSQGCAEIGSGGSSDNPIWDFLGKQGKGFLGFNELWDWLVKKEKPGALSIRSLGLGIILDTLGNPDEDWAKSLGSAAIENVVIGLLAKRFPPIAIITALNDIGQAAIQGGRLIQNPINDFLAANPEMQSDLDAIADRFFDHGERVDLNRLTEPLADLVYDYTIMPRLDAATDFWQDPSLINALRVQKSLFAPIASPVPFLMSGDAQLSALGDGTDFISAGLDFAWGAANLKNASSEFGMAYTAAWIAKGSDYLPLPDHWQDAIDEGATGFIDRLSQGSLLDDITLFPTGLPFDLPGLPLI